MAVFLIINSHMDALYVKYDILATGDAIGNVLFLLLFASGYTLLLSKRNLCFDCIMEANSLSQSWLIIFLEGLRSMQSRIYYIL